jgi:(1->4)-alpha-D-glucan 1-alpha-D-glucosylmutase
MVISTVPRSTARLQFFDGFTMDDAVRVVPYLARLGISHLYASPLLKARPKSTHCYDIVDHNEINPELGGEEALRRLVATLRSHGMGLILDIVPNHMGVGGADNHWWLDVLEWGRTSPYAEFFDIDWTPPDASMHGKILAPFLGCAYGDALESGDIVLQLDSDSGGLLICYHEHHFPISARGAALVLHSEPSLNEIAHLFGVAAKSSGRFQARKAAGSAKEQLVEFARSENGAVAVANALAKFSAATPEGRVRLHALLERQHYRLSWWRAAADEINWRRFFDINTLAGVRVEVPRVFDETHRKILALYSEGLIDGVRIDHIDGLADPRLYCRKLRRAMATAGERRPDGAPAGPPYIVVEKILAQRERLPADWLTNGTTGYDFMDQVAAVLHDPEGEAPLTRLWIDLTANNEQFEAQEISARRQILSDNLASELNASSAALHRIALRDLSTRDYTLTALRRALTEILVHFPAYRIYAGRAGHSDADAQLFERALSGARKTFRAADRQLLDLLRRWLLDESPRDIPAGPRRTERLRAMVRFQQLSAPVAAKSVEDTTFYRYGRLLSRNEVGSYPGQFALPPAAFHAACAERHKRLPSAMIATATHDHKRGEDTRLRLAVLSEIPDEWEIAIGRWMRLNAIVRRDVGPIVADELMLYQTLVAAWPLGLDVEDSDGIRDFAKRVGAWFEKSVREAKLLSEWAAPNDAYEAACQEFLLATLDASRPVVREIATFAERLGAPGALNGLAQTLLRLTVPGVPDMYQGTELWDQSLVDPDNRRPVDFIARDSMLNAEASLEALLRDWQTGAVKQAIIVRALALRAERPKLFASGTYQKLDAKGPAAQNILAFNRRYERQVVTVAVSRLAARNLNDRPLLPAEFWAGTSVELPARGMRDVLTGRIFSAARVPVTTLFEDLPVALLAL